MLRVLSSGHVNSSFESSMLPDFLKQVFKQFGILCRLVTEQVIFPMGTLRPLKKCLLLVLHKLLKK